MDGDGKTDEPKALLIVPYGIETINRIPCACRKRLLIVPYGIETLFSQTAGILIKAFNRTLWN